MSTQLMVDTIPPQILMIFGIQAYINERKLWSKFQHLTPYGSGDTDTQPQALFGPFFSAPFIF